MRSSIEKQAGLFALSLLIGWASSLPHVLAQERPVTDSKPASDPTSVQATIPLQGKRILFLGDSNTHAGFYISWLETQLRAHRMDPLPELINLGLPSETCSGLSEPDHPFPRPDVHERLERALQRTKPDVVVVCYGMNDGIYYPFSPDRFEAFQRGINRLIEEIQASHAKVILMTPPVFDAVPLRSGGQTRPLGADRYAWFAPFDGYDSVLQQYAKWIVQQRERVDMVIDLHGLMSRFLVMERATDQTFTLAADGVHFDREGHRLVGESILRAWGLEPIDALPDEFYDQVDRRQRILHDAWLTAVGHQRPGMAPGLDLEEARRQAADLEEGLAVWSNRGASKGEK